ncbi:hypothetical protein C4572_02860 [Candidatus Parcubacteria bacterium]|nr:MAG: hypothetical protein C4572_02860 [Candidatus Parcubacteria bacterium]
MIIKGKIISRVLISTALGIKGKGIFPRTLMPSYRGLLNAAKETNTTVIGKSVTRYPRKGNFRPAHPFTWRFIQNLPNGGMLNAYGLTNPGVDKLGKWFRGNNNPRYPVMILSLYPEFSKGTELAIQETKESIDALDEIGELTLELNFSCPNSREKIKSNIESGVKCVKEVKKVFPFLTLIAKVSIVHPCEFSQELEKAGVDAIHSVNTIPFEMVYPGKISPMADVGGGGVSGKPIFKAAFEYNRGLREKIKIPLIVGGGVSCKEDVNQYFSIGADGVTMCTVVLRTPKMAQEIIETFNV